MGDAELVDHFVLITDAPRHVAEHILEAHGWDLESSVNFYIESGGVGHGRSDASPAPTRPLPLQVAPRSSPLDILDDEDEKDLNDDLVLDSNFARRSGPRHDILDHNLENDRLPRSRSRPSVSANQNAMDNDSDMSLDQDKSSDLVLDSDDDDDYVIDMTEGQLNQRRPPRQRRRATTRNGRNNSSNNELESHVYGVSGDDLPIDLPDDVDLEEQRMLLAAMTGEAYRGRVPDFSSDPRYRPQAQLSPGAQERQLLRQEQDAAYYESLEADKLKEEEAERRRQETERMKQEEMELKASVERAFESKRASLPKEPEAGDNEAVQIVVRLPDGGRIGRRFLPTDPLRSVFDFIDVETKGSEIQPDSYNLVSQFPRRVFSHPGENLTTAEVSLRDAKLNHKQEALFIEIK